MSKEEQAEQKKHSESAIDLPSVEPVDSVADDSNDDLKLPKRSRIKQFLSTRKGKIISVTSVVVIILAVLLAIPATRFGILGTFIKRDVRIVVTDSTTKKPATDAVVSVDGLEAKTDGDGRAVIQTVPVGDYTVKVTKKYYEAGELNYSVPIFADAQEQTVTLKATGRQVSVKVVNSITNKALAKAHLTVGDTSAITNSDGIASIVLPADLPKRDGSVALDGYNTAEVQVIVTEQSDANVVSLVPSGKVFYLSNATGKTNVVKSNLDGSDQQTIAEGTGSEGNDTVLLASNDWSYLLLSAKRQASDDAQLYLVNASTGALTTVDKGNSYFSLVGWIGHRFIYTAYNKGVNVWQNGQTSIKSFNADTGQTVTLDTSTGEGTDGNTYRQSSLHSVAIAGNAIVYARTWSGNNMSLSDMVSAIVSANVETTAKQNLKEFGQTASDKYLTLENNVVEPGDVYFRLSTDKVVYYYEYANGAVKDISIADATYYKQYPTYLVSPDGNKTFWSEQRDGKSTLLIGNAAGQNATSIGTDYAAYGWFGDDYVLVSKDSSELYVASSKDSLGTPLKVGSYYKPQGMYFGYGGI